MAVSIRIISSVDGSPVKETGFFIKRFDVDAFNGRGHIVVTPDINEAMSFNGMAEAFKFWKQQSKIKPYRPDGRPNCPLTAYNVEMVTRA